MATVVRKGLIGKQDVKFYSSASPTFTRVTSTGGSTTMTAIAATHIPLSNATSGYWTVNNVERALNETGVYRKSAQATLTSHAAKHVSAEATLASHASKHTSAEATINTLNSASLNWAYWYRKNKPELSYATYGSTVVVTCPGSTTAPAEVMINGVVYRNKGTVLCDLSRTKTPAAATVGGLDRGPATATRAYYIYAVPTTGAHLSATRKFDLVASSQSQATGPLASSTFASWSFLGAVNTGATVRVERYVQNGDIVKIGKITDTAKRLLSYSAPATYQARYQLKSSGMIPVGAKSIFVETNLTGSVVQSFKAFELFYGDPGQTAATSSWTAIIRSPRVTSSITGQNPNVSSIVEIPVNASRQFAWRKNVDVSATLDVITYLSGWALPRANWK